MQNTNSNLLTVLETAKANNGATYNINTGELNPKIGYMVANPENSIKVSELTKQVVSDFIRYNSETLSKPNTYVGFWFNNGSWYVEVSELYFDEKTALTIAKIRNQFSVWDNQYKMELLVTAKTEQDLFNAIFRKQTIIFVNSNTGISLPEPQRTGTMYQRKSYAMQQAAKLSYLLKND